MTMSADAPTETPDTTASAAGTERVDRDTGIREGQFRDRREAAFAALLISQKDFPKGDKITQAGGLFLLAAAGFVVLAALYAEFGG
ncbi:MAG: hypothetical protein ACFBSD_14730 [Paracoccaceae bacterium]